MWEPCTHALDRAPAALDAAPIQGSCFINEHTRDTDAREGEIAGGSKKASTRRSHRRLSAR
jgi:hypothetical protein